MQFTPPPPSARGLAEALLTVTVVSVVFTNTTTLCLKNAPSLKRNSSKIIRIDFDDIWQKYSKDIVNRVCIF